MCHRRELRIRASGQRELNPMMADSLAEGSRLELGHNVSLALSLRDHVLTTLVDVEIERHCESAPGPVSFWTVCSPYGATPTAVAQHPRLADQQQSNASSRGWNALQALDSSFCPVHLLGHAHDAQLRILGCECGFRPGRRDGEIGCRDRQASTNQVKGVRRACTV